LGRSARTTSKSVGWWEFSISSRVIIESLLDDFWELPAEAHAADESSIAQARPENRRRIKSDRCFRGDRGIAG
jgi:hypothetical protein